MLNRFRQIERIRIYLLISLLFILCGTLIILIKEKTSIHLTINSIHNAFFDSFFTYFTYVGDGLTAVIILLLLLLLDRNGTRIYFLILGGSTLLVSGFLAQFLKRMIYPDAERPIRYIGEHLLHLVPGVDVHEMNSFPSGHTATAFAFFAFLAFIWYSRSRYLQYLLVAMAILVGYSRMYLSQHFLEDVVMGAVVGIVSFLLAFSITALIPFKRRPA